MAPIFKIFTLALAVFLTISDCGYGQYGALPVAHRVALAPLGNTNGYVTLDQYPQHAGGRFYPYPSRAEAVKELYYRNAQKPLRGLFADEFTRTLTVLGGGNFLTPTEVSSSLPGVIAAGSDDSSTVFESETGYGISFAFGRRHNHRLRSEIELALRGNDVSFKFAPRAIDDDPVTAARSSDDDRIGAYSVMKNFITGFENSSRLTPYIGAGLGWSYIDLDAESVGVDQGSGAFSYQAIGGVATTLNSLAEFVVEYRFLGTTEVDIDGIEDSITYRAHNLFLGVKFEY